MGHPTIDELRALSRARLGGAERAGVEAHLRACAECQDLFERVEAALAASAAAPRSASLDSGLNGETLHRHLSGNDQRLEAAILGGLRDVTQPRPRGSQEPRRPQLVYLSAVALAAVALLAVLPTWLMRSPEAPPRGVAPTLSLHIEGPAGQDRGPAVTPPGLVAADAAARIAPGQGARLGISAPGGGWLYVFSVDEDGAHPAPGVSPEGMSIGADGEALVPAAGEPPWRAAGEPGDVVMAVVLADSRLDPEELEAASAAPDPWAALEALGRARVYRAVLRFGGGDTW